MFSSPQLCHRITAVLSPRGTAEALLFMLGSKFALKAPYFSRIFCMERASSPDKTASKKSSARKLHAELFLNLAAGNQVPPRDSLLS